jgi:hypothetical protein
MKARPGDRIVLAASHVGEPTRDGRVVEARGADGGPPFVVEWSDGHTGIIYPGPGAVLRVSGADEPVPAAGTVSSGNGAPAMETSAPQHETLPEAQAMTGEHGSSALASRSGGQLPHVRDWTVRITIFEGGDDTSAQAVLVADAPEHLRARGESHRSQRDRMSPEIGDEVAVARALRHLADQLMTAAEDDIAASTGEDVYVRRS